MTQEQMFSMAMADMRQDACYYGGRYLANIYEKEVDVYEEYYKEEESESK